MLESNSLDLSILSPRVVQKAASKPDKAPRNAIYSSTFMYQNIANHDITMNAIDRLLETEQQTNKTETWNKLDNTQKIIKLHGFADVYGKEHAISEQRTAQLKKFLSTCLENNKLKKTKDLVYDKTKQMIISIPSLHLNNTTNQFTLRVVDPKRVSTLKALTPLRTNNARIFSTDDIAVSI